MKITTEQINEIAELSRLSLAETERAEITAQLGQIADFMDILSGLDTAAPESGEHDRPAWDIFRADIVEPSMERAALLQNAPSADGTMFLVPKTVE